jgi:Amidase
VRLPAAHTGVFALKPSLGRVPMYPLLLRIILPEKSATFRDHAPLPRSRCRADDGVADAVSLMTVLTRPDPRDFMALPRRDIDWPQALDADLKGKRIGLVHDIGAGLKPQPQVRDSHRGRRTRVRGSRRRGHNGNGILDGGGRDCHTPHSPCGPAMAMGSGVVLYRRLGAGGWPPVATDMAKSSGILLGARPMRVYEAIVKGLEAVGVDAAFGGAGENAASLMLALAAIEESIAKMLGVD